MLRSTKMCARCATTRVIGAMVRQWFVYSMLFLLQTMAKAGAPESPMRMQEHPSPISAPVLECIRPTRTTATVISFSEDTVDDTAEMSEHECSHSHDDDDDPPSPVPYANCRCCASIFHI